MYINHNRDSFQSPVQRTKQRIEKFIWTLLRDSVKEIKNPANIFDRNVADWLAVNYVHLRGWADSILAYLPSLKVETLISNHFHLLQATKVSFFTTDPNHKQIEQMPASF